MLSICATGRFKMVWAFSFWVSSELLVVNPSPFWVVPRSDKESLSGPGHTKMYAFFVEGNMSKSLAVLLFEYDCGV